MKSLVFWSSLLSLIQSAQNDPCSGLDTRGGIYPSSKVLACFNSFPIDLIRKERTFDTIEYVMNDLYVFADSAKGGFDQTQSVKDLFQEARKYPHATEFEMALDLNFKFRTLKDMHSSFETNCFFQNYRFLKGLPLISIVENNCHKIYVSYAIIKPYTKYVKENLGLDLMDYVGAEVLKIDGRPAIQVLSDYSGRYSNKRDPNAAFNELFTKLIQVEGISFPNPGDWFNSAFPPVKAGTFDYAQSFSYTLRLSSGEITTVTLPVAAIKYSQSKFGNSQEFFKQCIHPGLITLLKQVESGELDQPGFLESLDLPTESGSSNDAEFFVDQFPPPPGSNSTSQVLYDQGVFKLVQLEQRTGLLTISSFLADPETSLTHFRSLVEIIQRQDFEKFIFDMTGNDGGNASLMYPILSYFSGINSPQYPLASMNAPLWQEIVSYLNGNFTITHPWSPSFFENPQSGQPFTDESYLLPDPLNPSFGTRLYWSIDSTILGDLPPFPLSLSQTAIISNAECYSSCAIFSRFLQENGALGIGVDGLPSEDISLGSGFGQLYGVNVLLLHALSLNYLCDKRSDPDCLLPTEFPLRVTSGFALRQFYPNLQDNTLLEFELLPVEKRIFHSLDDIYDEDKFLKRVIDLFR